ncbi:MAG TPA: DUF6382 domain-containing protein [Lachnospiraceae bacterium]|nr:DUF6382 domain-containing protein [Lachnospiraceae bacterium]
MDAEFKRDMNHSYMILKSREDMDMESYETRVILANNIAGILPCRLSYINEDTYFSYDITSRQSLPVLCESLKINKEDLRKILESILTTLAGLEDYLLDLKHLVLEPKFVYVNFETRQTSLCFVPFYGRDIRESLRNLTEYLLTKINHEDQEGVVLGYRFYHELQESNSQLGDMQRLLAGGSAGSVKDNTGGRPESGPEEEESGIRMYAGTDAANGIFEKNSGEYSKKAEENEFFYEENAGENGYGASDGREKSYEAKSGREKSYGAKRGREHVWEEKSTRLTVLRKLHVEPAAVRIAAGGAAIAAVVYVFLHFQGSMSANPYTWGGAAAGCAAAATAVYLVKNRKKKQKGEEQYEKEELFGQTMQDPGTVADELSDEEEPEEFQAEEKNIGTEEGETMLLSAAGAASSVHRAFLEPENPDKESPEIRLEQKDILIGKQAGLTDRVIPSQAVSRIHARIRYQGGRYYLRDMNSKNGSALNGTPLVEGCEEVLSDGDRVSFADVSYIFHG